LSIVKGIMGTSQKDKAARHEAIIAAASTSVRKKGLAGTTVADVMGAVGLTHGGFYAHFASRDELLVEAVHRAFNDGRASMESLMDAAPNGEAQHGLPAFASIYLSDLHAQSPANGCAAAALVTEVSRESPAIAAAFASGIADYIEALEGRFAAAENSSDTPGRPDRLSHRSDAALLLAALVGAVALRRAMQSSPLGQELTELVEAGLHEKVLGPRA
jgi:TetR/AcrR family transcriptional regulator, transcriptional repressor for nem operon